MNLNFEKMHHWLSVFHFFIVHLSAALDIVNGKVFEPYVYIQLVWGFITVLHF